MQRVDLLCSEECCVLTLSDDIGESGYVPLDGGLVDDARHAVDGGCSFVTVVVFGRVRLGDACGEVVLVVLSFVAYVVFEGVVETERAVDPIHGRSAVVGGEEALEVLLLAGLVELVVLRLGTGDRGEAHAVDYILRAFARGDGTVDDLLHHGVGSTCRP